MLASIVPPGTIRFGLTLDAQHVGSTGISLGGFTSLAINSLDARFTTSFAMCPMYLREAMIFRWRRTDSRD